LARFTNAEMQDLAYAYARTTGGNAYNLLSTIQAYAPAQAARYAAAAAFTYTATGRVHVLSAAPAGATVPVPPSANVFNTLEEIYLDFRTAPVGSMSPAAAAYSTTVYAAANLSAAFSAGYMIGTGIHWLIETYDPAIDNAIGAALDSIVSNVVAAATGSAFPSLGYWEYELDRNAFGVNPVDLLSGSGSQTNVGDWGALDDSAGWFFGSGYMMCFYNPAYC
jgi:hypothetical protein